jgi:hypothetical protein
MDGLDTYIDDYTREDPIPEGILKRLVQAQAFLEPNAQPLEVPSQGSVADAKPESAKPSALSVAEATPAPLAAVQPSVATLPTHRGDDCGAAESDAEPASPKP